MLMKKPCNCTAANGDIRFDDYNPYIEIMRTLFLSSLEDRIYSGLREFVYTEDSRLIRQLPQLKRCVDAVTTWGGPLDTICTRYKDVGILETIVQHVVKYLIKDGLIATFVNSVVLNNRLNRICRELDAIGIEENLLRSTKVWNFISEKDYWMDRDRATILPKDDCGRATENYNSDLDVEVGSKEPSTFRERAPKRPATYSSTCNDEIDHSDSLEPRRCRRESEDIFEASEKLLRLESSRNIFDGLRKREGNNGKLRRPFNTALRIKRRKRSDKILKIIIWKSYLANHSNYKSKRAEIAQLSLPCKAKSLMSRIFKANPFLWDSCLILMKRKFETCIRNVCSCLNDVLRTKLNGTAAENCCLFCEIRPGYIGFKLKPRGTRESRCYFVTRVPICQHVRKRDVVCFARRNVRNAAAPGEPEGCNDTSCNNITVRNESFEVQRSYFYSPCSDQSVRDARYSAESTEVKNSTDFASANDFRGEMNGNKEEAMRAYDVSVLSNNERETGKMCAEKTCVPDFIETRLVDDERQSESKKDLTAEETEREEELNSAGVCNTDEQHNANGSNNGEKKSDSTNDTDESGEASGFNCDCSLENNARDKNEQTSSELSPSSSADSTSERESPCICYKDFSDLVLLKKRDAETETLSLERISVSIQTPRLEVASKGVNTISDRPFSSLASGDSEIRTNLNLHGSACEREKETESNGKKRKEVFRDRCKYFKDTSKKNITYKFPNGKKPIKRRIIQTVISLDNETNTTECVTRSDWYSETETHSGVSSKNFQDKTSRLSYLYTPLELKNTTKLLQSKKRETRNPVKFRSSTKSSNNFQRTFSVSGNQYRSKMSGCGCKEDSGSVASRLKHQILKRPIVASICRPFSAKSLDKVKRLLRTKIREILRGRESCKSTSTSGTFSKIETSETRPTPGNHFICSNDFYRRRCSRSIESLRTFAMGRNCSCNDSTKACNSRLAGGSDIFKSIRYAESSTIRRSISSEYRSTKREEKVKNINEQSQKTSRRVPRKQDDSLYSCDGCVKRQLLSVALSSKSNEKTLAKEDNTAYLRRVHERSGGREYFNKFYNKNGEIRRKNKYGNSRCPCGAKENCPKDLYSRKYDKKYAQKLISLYTLVSDRSSSRETSGPRRTGNARNLRLERRTKVSEESKSAVRTRYEVAREELAKPTENRERYVNEINTDFKRKLLQYVALCRSVKNSLEDKLQVDDIYAVSVTSLPRDDVCYDESS